MGWFVVGNRSLHLRTKDNAYRCWDLEYMAGVVELAVVGVDGEGANRS